MYLEEHHQSLKKAGLKSTKHRKEMLHFIHFNTEAHPTPQEIFDHLSRKNTNVSLGNVYRNLSILEEKDLIRRVGNIAPARYELVDENSHFHIICIHCGGIQNVYSLNTEKMKMTLFNETKFKLVDCKSSFLGTCPDCSSLLVGGWQE